MINQSTVTSDSADHKAMTWRLIGALLMFLGLSWLALDVHAQVSSEAAFATISMAPTHAVTTNDTLATALGESTSVFTLTVLNTNDTWGYLDPCG